MSEGRERGKGNEERERGKGKKKGRERATDNPSRRTPLKWNRTGMEHTCLGT
jgi:hypothetical protein